MKTKRVYPYIVEELVTIIVLIMTVFFMIIIILEFAFQDIGSSIALLLIAILALYNIFFTYKKEVINFWCHIVFTDNNIVSYRMARPLCCINREETIYYAIMYQKEYRAKTEVVVISNSPLFDNNIINNGKGKTFRYSTYFCPAKQIVLPTTYIFIDSNWVKETIVGNIEF